MYENLRYKLNKNTNIIAYNSSNKSVMKQEKYKE